MSFYSVIMSILVQLFFFFFFKQKTAYEMRISDWSSDVCSSDLDTAGADGAAITGVAAGADTSAPVTGQVGTAIAGAYGTLTLAADGSYTHQSAADSVPPAGGTHTFVYTLTEGDGDTPTTTLTIHVSDKIRRRECRARGV